MEEYPYLSRAIGISIENMRKSRRMTKTALADLACLERRYLREIEQGTKKPTVNAVYFICDALQLSPCEFFNLVEMERQKLLKQSKLVCTER